MRKTIHLPQIKKELIMKKFFENLNIEIIIILIFIALFILFGGIVIYDIATTTYEYVNIEGTVIDKDIQYEQHAVYKTVDGKSVLDHFDTETTYYLFCSTDSSEIAKIKVNFVNYYSYQKNDTIPLVKVYRYKKGTDIIKGINYELR